MKKNVILLILGILCTSFIFAQKDSLFVSINGGQKSLFGHLKYNYYHFQHHSNMCDSLICLEPGYEACKISKNYIKYDDIKDCNYKTFNKAILKTIKYIKKHQLESGEFTEKIHDRIVVIQFKNGTPKGEGIFLIQVLK